MSTPESTPHAPYSDPRQQLAMGLGIGFDGRSYRYKDYRYDRIGDAINYAELDTARANPDAGAQHHPWLAPNQPTEAERVQMKSYQITFENGQYHHYGFRYDRLVDAVNNARRND